MGKGWILTLLAALTVFSSPARDLPAPSPEAPAMEYRCLAVGIDRFVNEETTTPCSANNAETIAGLFRDCLPKGTKVTRRVNGPGSAEEMEDLIRVAFRGAGEKDTSFLYLSTHGVAWTEENQEKAVLILSDGEREEALAPDTLRRMMDEVPGKKVLILDCCHAGAVAESFRGPEWRVLAGCLAEEDCYFWAAGEVTGTGYFTAALENALRAAGKEQIDPDGNGEVSLSELCGRIREIYGVSNAVFLPEEDNGYLFTVPEEQAGERILDLRFDPVKETEEQIILDFHFRTETEVKLEYRLVPRGADGWDFSRGMKMPDRARSGQKRGVLSAGEKDRTIKLSRDRLGESEQVLLQIVSYRGLYRQVPVPEATRIIKTGEKNEP